MLKFQLHSYNDIELVVLCHVEERANGCIYLQNENILGLYCCNRD